MEIGGMCMELDSYEPEFGKMQWLKDREYRRIGLLKCTIFV